jgi:hypothetical protein
MNASVDESFVFGQRDKSNFPLIWCASSAFLTSKKIKNGRQNSLFASKAAVLQR